MGKLSNKLVAIVIEAIAELQNHIDIHGVESIHSNTKVLQIEDENFMFNLDGGRYLTEISKGTLIDNQGYVCGHDVLPITDLISLIDHLTEVCNTGEGTKWERKCDITGEGMNSGWYDENHKGISYIKKREDIIKHIKDIIAQDDEFKNELPTITEDRLFEIAYNHYGIYWTEWEDENDYQFIEGKDGKLIEIEE
jgi:hypothetical protein